MKNVLILTLASIAILANSCKKDKCKKIECGLEGKYKVEVKVSKRLPLLIQEPVEDLYPYKNYYGKILLETNENVCCRHYIHNYKCPLQLTYNLSGLEIIVKSNNAYFIKGEWTTGQGKDVSFDLPLSIMSNKLIYDKDNDQVFGDSIYLLDINKVNSDASDYPYAIKWFSIELERKDKNTLVGQWVFNDQNTYSCDFTYPNSSNKYSYSMCEFAEVTFIKTE